MAPHEPFPTTDLSLSLTTYNGYRCISGINLPRYDHSSYIFTHSSSEIFAATLHPCFHVPANRESLVRSKESLGNKHRKKQAFLSLFTLSRIRLFSFIFFFDAHYPRPSVRLFYFRYQLGFHSLTAMFGCIWKICLLHRPFLESPIKISIRILLRIKLHRD